MHFPTNLVLFLYSLELSTNLHLLIHRLPSFFLISWFFFLRADITMYFQIPISYVSLCLSSPFLILNNDIWLTSLEDFAHARVHTYTGPNNNRFP